MSIITITRGSYTRGKQVAERVGERLGERCVKNLKKHGFDAHFVSTPDEAKDLILSMVSGHETFGFGGSDTTRSLGVLILPS